MNKHKQPIIALAGNPNSGKSSVFNHLTGLRQKIGNFPGVTVEKKIGKTTFPNNQEVTIIDLPGTYSLHPTSHDERVVLNVLVNPNDPHYPDAIIYIADTTNLEKHFLLLTQILDLGFPTVLALNMTDLAEKEGTSIDKDKLAKYLGIPLVTISGRKGENLEILKEKAQQALSEKITSKNNIYKLSAQESSISKTILEQQQLANEYQSLLFAHHYESFSFLKEGDKKSISNLTKNGNFQSLHFQIAETMQRFQSFGEKLNSAIKKTISEEKSLTDKLDGILVHKVFGPIIFFAVMLLVFQAIFAWAESPMDWIDGVFGAAGEFVKATFPEGWVTDLITDGILAGLGGILIFIPQIAILFFLIALLEEVGYMARAVFMFDKIMQKFGLNGRSVVALVSGGACAIPAIMSTRTIGNWKERLITILVTPFISCAARIPVYAILIGFVVPAKIVWGFFNLQGLAFMGLYLLGIAAALISAYVFKKILRSNEPSFLMLELPQYRPPAWKNVGLTIKEKVGAFVIEAGKIIMIISIILWFLASYGPGQQMAQAESEAIELAEQQSLSDQETEDLIASKKIEASYAGHLGKFIEPAIEPLGYDWKIGIALITSFAAREVFVGTMATIYSIGSSEEEATIRERLANAKNPITGAPVYTLATSLSLLIFYVFAMQCMSTLAVVRKETGSWKWPVIQFVFMTVLAYLGGLFVYQILG